jgi:hypothetical protein
MPFAPEAIHHKIYKFHKGIVVKFRSQQLIQFAESFQEFRMVISGLYEFLLLSLADIDQRNLRLQEIRQRKLIRLDIWAGELYTKSHPEIMPFCSIKGEVPYRV